MNYDYSNIKIKAVDKRDHEGDCQYTISVNNELEKIQENGSIVEDIKVFYLSEMRTIRTIIVYREIKVKEEQK